MLLAMDIGNTNIKIGIFEKENLITSWRLSVTTPRTADEYYITIMDLFSTKSINLEDINGIIISSVVPSLNYTLEHMCTYYFKQKPIMVSTNIKTGLTFDYENPEELGADRIVNAVAAHNIYKSAAIICDLGTATTIGAIDSKGCFLGGAIAPGLKSSIDALASNAARLHRIELQRPKSAIGKNTVENMQSGAVHGFIGLVSNIINQFKSEMKDSDIKIIGTGGLTQLIIDENYNMFDLIDRALTLKGLNIIYNMNK